MNRLSLTAVITLILILLAGCTANQMAKNYGGTMNLDLTPGQKLVSATWKEDHLWYLTRPKRDGEKPEILTFHEDSSFGLLQGTVVFKEH